MKGIVFRRARSIRWAIAAWLGALGWVAPALGQTTDTPVTDQRIPGWVFTPAVRFAGSYDDNAAVRLKGDVTARDYLTTVGPDLNLDFTGRRTQFRMDYSGSFMLYRELTELNAYDQQAFADLRYRLTPHVTFFTHEMFTVTPTTDRLQLGAVPFRREGARMNDGRLGFEAQFTRRTSLVATYEHQWVRFNQDEELPVLFRGGFAQGGSLVTTYQVTPRLALTADYSMSHATIGAGQQTFDFQNGGGGVEVKVLEDTTLSATVGASRLLLGDLGDRTGLRWKVGLNRRSGLLLYGVEYFRSFLPSFALGGTFQNEELSAVVSAPFARNRAHWMGSTSWRINRPLRVGDLELHSFWLQTSLGYDITRRLSVEGFYSTLFQDTQIYGGRLNRNQIGFQIVTSNPMRIR
jgi:hypothetical protein